VNTSPAVDTVPSVSSVLLTAIVTSDVGAVCRATVKVA
jgi:hypothetical protein